MTNLDSQPAPQSPTLTASIVKRVARDAGFNLAGIAPALPVAEAFAYEEWVEQGRAGAMSYLTDHRMAIRSDPRQLLPSAKSVLCVGLLYNTPMPHTGDFDAAECGWISRYAWGEDYHQIVSERLRKVELTLRAMEPSSFEARLCVDTAPLLERSYARLAGLGWIGKNTCLINEPSGSWYFLGELLLSLSLEPDSPPPDRCGSCSRCIDACPTGAIIPTPHHGGRQHFVESRACISYYTIEKKGDIPKSSRAGNGAHVFGCDICQDVCPWNRKAPVTEDVRFYPAMPPAPSLERLANISESEFRSVFRHSPVSRARYRGFLRNVAIAMGNSGDPRFHAVLTRLSQGEDDVVASHARWALVRLRQSEVARVSKSSEGEPQT